MNKLDLRVIIKGRTDIDPKFETKLRNFLKKHGWRFWASGIDCGLKPENTERDICFEMNA